MKRTILKHVIATLIMLVLTTGHTVAQEMEGAIVNVAETLNLTDKQAAQVQGLLVQYRANMDGILLKYEDLEEPDVAAMIGEVRDLRDDYRKDLKEILNETQYDAYMATIDAILTDMFNDLAEIRLIDIQKEVGLSDQQLVSLVPIVGKGLKKTVQLLFENVGERLSLPKKIKIKNSLKKIEKERRAGMETILSPDQMEIYDAYKEAQKENIKKKK
jgi:hypothetical protein